MFARNRQAVFFTFFAPLMIMTIFGLIGFDNVAKIEIGTVLNAPPTSGTKMFLEQLKQIPAFNIHEGTVEDERAAIIDGDRSVVLIIPFDLIPQVPQINSPKTVIALTNEGQAQQANTAISIVNQILDKTTIALARTPTMFNLVSETINARNLKYIDFLIPGVVALAVMQMSVFSVGFVFTSYKEKGILKRLIATPMRPYQFVTANVITRLLVTVVQTLVLIAIGVFLFKAHMLGSYWLVLLISSLGAIMFLGLGFTISGIASTVEAVPAIANLVVFPMLFLGNTFFPISTMPDWLQKVANVLPLTYFSSSLREVMIKDASISAIAPDLLWMLLWSVVLVITAIITFGFEEKRQ